MRLVDKHLGAWLCHMLAVRSPGFVAGTSGGLIDPVEPEPESVREILVMKFLGMGSILQATPLFERLRRRYPEAG